MKGAVLVTITRLVQALGPEVVSIVDFVTGVVEFSADVVADHELYTLEDGLNLWLAVLRGLAAPHPPLLALYPNCVRVIERDFEFLQICMHITESQVTPPLPPLLPLHPTRSTGLPRDIFLSLS